MRLKTIIWTHWALFCASLALVQGTALPWRFHPSTSSRHRSFEAGLSDAENRFPSTFSRHPVAAGGDTPLHVPKVFKHPLSIASNLDPARIIPPESELVYQRPRTPRREAHHVKRDWVLPISNDSTSQYGPGNWSTTVCSPVLTGNTGYTNAQMWAEADADGAWEYIANLHWDRSTSWSSFAARRLNLSSWQQYNCHILSDDNRCPYQQDCNPTITPGAWMVVNSFANLWGFHNDLFNLVSTARGQVNVDLVVNSFSPQFDTAAYLQHQIFLTGVTFGVILALGAIFSIGAEFFVAGLQVAAAEAEAATVKAVTAQLIKTGLTPEEAAVKAQNIASASTSKALEEAKITASIMYSHDIIAGVSMYEILAARYADGFAEDGLAAQNVLHDLITNTTNAWQSSEAAFIDQLFNGSQTSITNLGKSIANGTWLTPWNETSSHSNFTSDALPRLRKHLYGAMIPYAWAAATKSKVQYMPIVITADGCLNSINDLNNNRWVFPMRYDKDVDDIKVCFEGKTFWLLTPFKSGQPGQVSQSGMVLGSDQVRFQIPPGLKMLNGDSNSFGGLTVKDIVVSSYYAWTNNSFINPSRKPSGARLSGNKAAWEQGVQYPGFFNYPICYGLLGIGAAAQSFWDKSYTIPC